MHSCLYEGRVRHSRREGKPHRFARHLWLAYIDLDEVTELVDRGWIADRGSCPTVFSRKDHFGSTERPLVECVRDEVEKAAGRRPRGAVRVLTLLRQWGYYFNPLSLFYCFDERGFVEAIVAEVCNTPWGERHLYALGSHNRQSPGLAFEHAKALHVSPFFDERLTYRWKCLAPGDHLAVRISALRGDQTVFAASLTLNHVAWTSANQRRLAWAYPALTWQVTAAIYYEAFKLWWKGNAYVPHPIHDPVGHATYLARGT